MIAKEIEQYYNSGIEKHRLSNDVSQLEEARSREIILRYLTDSSLKIVDVGGGVGVYSFWLKKLGHQVHLVDPVNMNINAAKEYAIQNNNHLNTYTITSADQLPFSDNEMDIVLLMGPLYHLQEKEKRLEALTVAKRILKKNGIIICAAISRYASTLDGFTRNLVADKNFVSIMKQDLINGKHMNPTNNFDYFTTSFFHHPNELKEEIIESGFQFKEILPVESFGWLIPDFAKKWKDVEFQNILLETIRQTEKENNLLGVSAHLLAFGINNNH